MNTPLVKTAVIAALFLLVLTACGGAAPSATEAATQAPAQTTATESPFGDPSVPFEGVVQILAMYYDENGELQEGWTGSGTIVSPDGYILTNAHVVLPDRYFPVDELIVAMTVGQDQEPVPMYFAETLQADAALDLAVIRVTHDYDGNELDYETLNLPFVPIGSSDDLNLGDAITILGYPGIGGNTVTLTRGEVSGFTSQPEYGVRAFIKTSATIAGGNSGGLAATVNGQLIGVPTQLGYGGDDQYVDCRVLADTNRDGFVDEFDTCVPTGGFINALRPVTLALPLLEAAQRGEVSIIGVEEPLVEAQPAVAGAYSDDFSDENSGWDVYTEESGAAYYTGGEYFVEDYPENPYYTALSNQNFDNVQMTIEFRFEQSSDGGQEIDFVCRYLDSENGYEFRVFADGSVGIAKWLAGEYLLLSDPYQTGAVFGSSMHQAIITCDGSYLGLSIDGETVAEAFDDSFISGDIGMAVYTPTDTFVAAFDNFEAIALGTPVVEDEGDIVIDDTFDSNSLGWQPLSDSDYDMSIMNGAFHFATNPAQFQILNALPPALYDLANIVINVDVNIEQPAHDGDLGVLCRYQDVDNFYALEVSEDGYFAIWKEVAGEVTYLIEWTYSDLIPTDSSPFVLNASCDGAQLMVGVNAELLGTATDAEFASGGVGLITGTWANGGQVISFDNFEVIVYE